MYSLSQPIINEIVVNGRKYVLNLAFDNVLRVFELWKEDLFSEEEKLNLSLDALIKRQNRLKRLSSQDKNELLKAIFDNFIVTESKTTGDGQKSFDFLQDANYIYASFLMDYGIDLFNEQGCLHWWKFISLFQGLSERTKIREVMNIRVRKIPEHTKYNAEEIKVLLELKAAYALEINQEEQERQFERSLNRLADALEKRAVVS